MSNLYLIPFSPTAADTAARNFKIDATDSYSVPAKILTGALVNSAITILGAVETATLLSISLITSPLLLINNRLCRRYLPAQLVSPADKVWNSATTRTYVAAAATFAALKGIFGIYKNNQPNPHIISPKEKKTITNLWYENYFLQKDLEATREQSNMKAKLIRKYESDNLALQTANTKLTELNKERIQFKKANIALKKELNELKNQVYDEPRVLMAPPVKNQVENTIKGVESIQKATGTVKKSIGDTRNVFQRNLPTWIGGKNLPTYDEMLQEEYSK